MQFSNLTNYWITREPCPIALFLWLQVLSWWWWQTFCMCLFRGVWPTCIGWKGQHGSPLTWILLWGHTYISSIHHWLCGPCPAYEGKDNKYLISLPARAMYHFPLGCYKEPSHWACHYPAIPTKLFPWAYARIGRCCIIQGRSKGTGMTRSGPYKHTVPG